MYSVGVSDHIMIAHSFKGDPYFGPAGSLHGATYDVSIEISTETLNKHFVVMDIGALKTVLRKVLSKLDYKNLDEMEEFKAVQTTTEFLSGWIAKHLLCEIAGLPEADRPLSPYKLRATLKESPNAFATFESVSA